MNTNLSEHTRQPKGGEIRRTKTYDMAYIAIFTVLIAISSWITIPAAVPFTMQTFAVFFAVSILGGKRGTLAIIVYILLGAIGVPVFSGFGGGIGVLMNTTGGYIIGFLLSALIMWAAESTLGKKLWVQALSMILGLLACYAACTLWFMVLYMKTTGDIGLLTVLGWCVIPFIIPDLLKIALALGLRNALKKPLANILH